MSGNIMTNDAIEAVARAIRRADPYATSEDLARAAIAAMPAPVPQPEPGEVEITDEMIRAGQQAGDKRLSEWNGRECHLDGMSTVVEYAYRAMRRAALRSTTGESQ